MKRFLWIVLVMMGVQSVQAQLSRTMHQVFEIDSVGMVKIELWPQNDNYQWEVESWPSRHLMVETNIGLTNANEAILDFLMEEKRYELQIEKEPDIVTLSNVLEELTPIGTKKGDINETIRLIIYMPGFLEKVDDTTWKRIEPIRVNDQK